MTVNELFFLVVISLTFNLLTGIGMIWVLIEFKAMQRSTHHVQYIDPMKQEFEDITQELKQKTTKEDFDNIM